MVLKIPFLTLLPAGAPGIRSAASCHPSLLFCSFGSFSPLVLINSWFGRNIQYLGRSCRMNSLSPAPELTLRKICSCLSLPCCHSPSAWPRLGRISMWKSSARTLYPSLSIMANKAWLCPWLPPLPSPLFISSPSPSPTSSFPPHVTLLIPLPLNLFLVHLLPVAHLCLLPPPAPQPLIFQ